MILHSCRIPTFYRKILPGLRRFSSEIKTIRDVDLSNFPPEKIRNFSIVAHVDHGKSTLADRILETVGAIDVTSNNKQVLDKLQVERERGITVKAQSVSLLYNYQGEEYILNLIDTPGHVDFSYEVTRSLRACQGVLLLVDANQGVQAQTVSNFFLAFSNNLAIVPVVNKIDLPNADPESVIEQLFTLFELDPGDVKLVSAKLGIGVDNLLDTIIEKIPPPEPSDADDALKILLFDSWFDRYKGAINLVQVSQGVLHTGSTVVSCKTGKSYNVKGLGIMTPDPKELSCLYPGQVGFMVCNMRNSKEAVIGDTYHLLDVPVEPLLEIKPSQPMLFAGLYPYIQAEHSELKLALEKLCLNDNSVTVSEESSPALGHGWRLGFLGILHMEVFSQRLQQEFNAEVIITSPSVPYKLITKGKDVIKRLGPEIIVSNPSHWLDGSQASDYLEPIVSATIITPAEYLSPLLDLCNERRGEQVSIVNIDQTRLNMQYIFPFNEIATDFFDQLKSRSSGYASFDYEDEGYRSSDVVKLDVMLNGVKVPELACIVHSSKARVKAKAVVAKLKDQLPRQQFAVAIQAAVGRKILARQDLNALKKDVTAKCYGGDISRKMKLLKNQAEGKKRLKKIGRIEVNQTTLLNILKK